MTQQPYGYPQQPPPQQYQQFPGQVSPQEYQQAYPPQQPAYGTPPPQSAPTGADAANPFNIPGAPVGSGGELEPKLHQLVGRLVILKVRSYDPQNRFEADSNPVPQAVCEAIVIDGGPIAAAVDGRSRAETPFPGGPKHVPIYIKALYVRSAVMAPQLLPFLDKGVTLGRIAHAPANGSKLPPYILNQPSPEEVQQALPFYEGWDQIARAAAPPAAPVQPFQQVPAAAPMGQPAAQPYQQGPPQPWSSNPANQPTPQPQYQQPYQQPQPQYQPQQFPQPQYQAGPPVDSAGPPPAWAQAPQQPPVQQAWPQPQQGPVPEGWPTPPSQQPWQG